MRQTSRAIIAGLTLGLSLPLAALAEPMKQGGDGQKYHMHMERMADELNLTEQQKQQLDSMKAAHKKEREALREQSRAFHEKMRNVDPEKLSKSEINKLSKEAGALHEARTKAMLEGRAEFHGILTAEQKAKLQEMKEEHRQRWQERREAWREQQGMGDGMDEMEE